MLASSALAPSQRSNTQGSAQFTIFSEDEPVSTLGLGQDKATGGAVPKRSIMKKENEAKPDVWTKSKVSCELQHVPCEQGCRLHGDMTPHQTFVNS